MLGIILVILIILWFFGYIHLSGLSLPDFNLFTLNNHTITFWDLLIFFVIIWAIEAFPSPLREIAVVILILWLLSTLGIIAIAGLSSILVIAIIIGLVVSLIGVV